MLFWEKGIRMRYFLLTILCGVSCLTLTSGAFADSPYQLEENPAIAPDSYPFSLKLWGGIFDTSKSKASTNDAVNLLKGEEKEIEENFWAGGLNITDIPLFPAVKNGVGKWFFAGVDVFNLQSDYTVQAISADGLSSQKSELFGQTYALAAQVKISPLWDSLVQPYLGLGAGPAYTTLKDTRTTALTGQPLLLERDRNWDNSNLGEAFGGVDIYLGKSFHLNLEIRWLEIKNVHLIFPNPDTDHHTAKIKTTLQGWLSLFALGLHF